MSGAGEPVARRSRVTVVTVTWNSAAELPGLAASLPESCAGAEWDLVVVDNASDDASVAVAAEHGARVVQSGRNAGYAAGINLGIAASPSVDAYLVCNPDVRLGPGALRALLDGLGPSVGITVPRVVGVDGRPRASLRREPTVLRALGEAVLGGTRAGRYPRLGELVVDPAAYEREGTWDWASGAVMLLSRECVERVGDWDESYFLYSEETDFALRARDAGLALRYVPEATAVHHEGEAHVSPSLWATLTSSRVRCYARRHGRAATVAFRAAVALNEALRAHRSPAHRRALRALASRSGAATPS